MMKALLTVNYFLLNGNSVSLLRLYALHLFIDNYSTLLGFVSVIANETKTKVNTVRGSIRVLSISVNRTLQRKFN